MFNKIEKNQTELTNEQKCWEEIQAALKKYNCELTGYATSYDYDTEFEDTIAAEEFGVESIDYEARNIKALAEYQQNIQDAYQKACKDKYDELVSKCSKYKDLEFVRVGKSDSHVFWVKGLHIKKVNVNT